MFEKMDLKYKLRWVEMKIQSSQKSFSFWEEKEKEYKEKYGTDPKWFECKHIRSVKQNKKQALTDCLYWKDQLQILQAK